jgi:starch-binding outer membrane protein, SusD/RagB family
MRTIKQFMWVLLFSASTLLMFSGCSKFLDRKPLQASLDDLNQGGLEGQIYGMYGAIRNGDVAGQAFGGIPWMALHNFRSDDSEKGSSNADGADWELIHDKFQYVKDHWSATIYWDQHYTLIALANTALQVADSLKLNSPADQINIGEAKFFRAMAYFDLVRTYGQVPKIDFRIYNPVDARKPKASVAEVYTLIDADLQAAIASLPADWKNASGNNRFPGRLTNYAAKALRAKTMLYRGRWAEALTLSQDIINSGNYGLAADYFKTFGDEGENNIESIFEIQADQGPQYAGSGEPFSWFAICQGVRGSAEWDLGWGWNTPTANLVNAYAVGDKRKDGTILFSGQPDGVYGRTLPAYPAVIPREFWNKKVYPNPATQSSKGQRQAGWTNQKVLRYADVLLMAAEAANEVGGAANQTLAVNYINQIRTRAGLGNVAFTTQAAMRTIIQNERRFEMAMDGERFFDLVRWNLASTALGASGYQDKHKYYPIPQAAIDAANGILIQNPDY